MISSIFYTIQVYKGDYNRLMPRTTKKHKIRKGRRVHLPDLLRGCGLHRGTPVKFLKITSAVFGSVAAWWNSVLLPGLDAGAANGLQ